MADDKKEASLGKDEKEDKEEKKEPQGAESSADDTEKDKEKPAYLSEDWLKDFLAKSLGIKDQPKQVLETVDFKGIAKLIKDNMDKGLKVITMAGAGISTSAGIPDFRSPETGLYHNLQKYNLPDPMAIFSLDFFKENPEPFFMLAKELWPGVFKPTPCHYFLRLLQEKGVLLRHYTQNIDTLESIAGLDPELVVEAHGSFRSAHCLKENCQKEYDQDWMKDKVMKGTVPHCEIEDCNGVVKPDIVFFGESLPGRFAICVAEDFAKCDLLIILGTSLVVQPFASLINRVPDTTPRLSINMEKTGAGGNNPITILFFGGGLKFDDPDNYRDVFWGGKCDDGCYALADEIGCGEELRNLVKKEHAKIDEMNQPVAGENGSSPKTSSKASTSKPELPNSSGTTPVSKNTKMPSTTATPRSETTKTPSKLTPQKSETSKTSNKVTLPKSETSKTPNKVTPPKSETSKTPSKSTPPKSATSKKEK